MPEPVENLKGKGENTTAISVAWTLPENTLFKVIRVRVTKPDGAQFNLTYPYTTTNAVIGNLLAGLMYDVAVFVVASARESAGASGRYGTSKCSVGRVKTGWCTRFNGCSHNTCCISTD